MPAAPHHALTHSNPPQYEEAAAARKAEEERKKVLWRQAREKKRSGCAGFQVRGEGGVLLVGGGGGGGGGGDGAVLVGFRQVLKWTTGAYILSRVRPRIISNGRVQPRGISNGPFNGPFIRRTTRVKSHLTHPSTC